MSIATSLAALTGRSIPTAVAHPMTYRSKDGSSYFQFSFVPQANEIAVYCLEHPPLNGHDPDPHKTHLFESGKICFVEGKAPREMKRAKELAAQWSEYFVEYSRTGIAQK